MRYISPLLLVALLAGCAPGIDRRVALNALVGQPETEIVRLLGVPSRTFEAGGHTFLAYSERRVDSIPAGPFYGGGFGYFGGYGYFGGFPATVIERSCETTFEVVDGRAIGWSLRGNAC